MTALIWDEIGKRYFQTGVDRGVIYTRNGVAVPWNGLTSVEEDSAGESQSFWMDGVKYLEKITPGDFSGKVKAWTYPVELDWLTGGVEDSPGLTFYEQPIGYFDLSYRTRFGNDLEGTDFGYRIHILYNITARPDAVSFNTLESDAVKPGEFGWAISGIPVKIQGFRPAVHLEIDSTRIPAETLKTIEDILYGTVDTEPRLPPVDELRSFFESYGALIIIDNGDGTWTAIDEANDYISMIDPTTFQIVNADATYLDATTYEISSTFPEEIPE